MCRLQSLLLSGAPNQEHAIIVFVMPHITVFFFCPAITFQEGLYIGSDSDSNKCLSYHVKWYAS